MMEKMQHPFYVRFACVLISLVLLYFILTSASQIFIPLTFALLFSLLLYPVVHFMEHKLHLGRAVASMTAVVLLLGTLVALIYFMAIQFISFSDDLPMLKSRIDEIYAGLQHWLSHSLHINSKAQTEYLNKSTGSLAESAISSVKSVFLSLTTIVLWTIFIVLFTFFMLFHRGLLYKFMLHLFGEEHKGKVAEIILETKTMVNGYIFALLLEMVIVSTVASVMFLIMGVKYALLLGMMAGILNIIPYIGIYSSIVIALVITFANSTGNVAVEAAAGLFGVHLLDSNVIMPRLVGGRVKMNPFVTILAVMVGEFVWGVPGMFLFIPIAGIMKLVCARVDGLEAWSILIGEEEKPVKVKKVKVKA